MEPAYWRTPAAMETALRRVDDLPKELQGLVLGYVRYAFTNESLRATVTEYFKDRAACEHRHGKIGTWDVGRVTDMSRLFRPDSVRNFSFNEDIGAWDTWAAGWKSKGCCFLDERP